MWDKSRSAKTSQDGTVLNQEREDGGQEQGDSSYILKTADCTDELAAGQEGKTEIKDNFPQFGSVNQKEKVAIYGDRKDCESIRIWAGAYQKLNFEHIKSQTLIRHPSGNVWSKEIREEAEIIFFSIYILKSSVQAEYLNRMNEVTKRVSAEREKF